MRLNSISIFVAVFACICLPVISVAENKCTPSDFTVAIDTGHSRIKPGAISARGVAEYQFNSGIANLLQDELVKAGFEKTFLIEKNGRDVSLEDRADTANKKKADLIISIHHDSVQPHYLLPWVYNKKKLSYSDIFHGFSIFYSEKNAKSQDSLSFAKYLGAEMLMKGFSPSLHHAEKIGGENRELIDKDKGIYKYDDLIVLRKSKMLAILLECGIIVNRAEENTLNEHSYQKKIVTAVVNALRKYCESMPRANGL